MNSTYKLSSFLILLTTLVGGCKKFVDVGTPTTDIVTSSVFNTNSGATAAQLVVYSKMANDPAIIDRLTGLSSDELFNYATDQTSKNLYSNTLQVTDATNLNEWASFYNYIYYENAILENLQNAKNISPKVKQQLIGEAEFMRAYFYFYLVNLYGDVPLALTTDYKINTALPRAPQAQVYQQMISDLKDAQGKLSSKYVDASDTASTNDRARPTSWAASALLARVYLFAADVTQNTGFYQNAEAVATTVINNTSLYNLSPLIGPASVFKKNSSEAIWQIIPVPTSGYTTEASFFLLVTAPPVTGSPSVTTTINTQLLNIFEPGDQRRVNWIGMIKDNNSGAIYYFPNKYQTPNTTSPPADEYSMIFRLAELYLIRAEASARQNNLGTAISDLNVIRNRAGLLPLSSTLTKDQVLTAIAKERQAEFFTEGHRWFDLKRTKQIDAVMSVVTPQKANNTSWKSYQQLYPIPQESISNSLNIKQNQGY